jgi:hypothetical protein
MQTTGKPFILFTSGYFTMNNCIIRIADAFVGWDAESCVWNGTFMKFTNSGFRSGGLSLIDISVSDSNYVFSIIVETGDRKRLSLDRFSLIRCGCIGSCDSPFKIELKPKDEKDVDVKFRNITIEDCFVTSSPYKSQAIYLTGGYDQNFVFESSTILYNRKVSGKIIYFDVSGLPSTSTELKTNTTFLDRFKNLCNTLNNINFSEENIMIGDYYLKELITNPCTNDVSDDYIFIYVSSNTLPLYNYVCPCEVCESSDVIEESCVSFKDSCTEISSEELCKFPKTAKVECTWLLGNTDMEISARCENNVCKCKFIYLFFFFYFICIYYCRMI